MMPSPSESGLHGKDMVVEAWRIARALPVATGVTVLVVAAICGFIMSTTGQTVRAESDVLGRIDEAGTRLVSVISDQGNAGLTPEAVDRISRLTSVEWVIGLGVAADVRNSALGEAGAPVPARYWWGELPAEVEINGRTPQPGEVLAGTAAQAELGLDQPVGSIDWRDSQLPIVGGFTALDPLASLNTGLLAMPGAEETRNAQLRSILVLATTPDQVEPLTAAVWAVLGVADPTTVRFETSRTLAEVRAAVAGELGRYSRQLVIGALGIGLILVAMVVYGSVTLRRQDFGRRRALGASRSTIIILIAVQNTLVGMVGVALGLVAGGMVVRSLTGGLPDLMFALAIGVLALLTVALATIPPAVVAAFRDPVRVLRVP